MKFAIIFIGIVIAVVIVIPLVFAQTDVLHGQASINYSQARINDAEARKIDQESNVIAQIVKNMQHDRDVQINGNAVIALKDNLVCLLGFGFFAILAIAVVVVLKGQAVG